MAPSTPTTARRRKRRPPPSKRDVSPPSRDVRRCYSSACRDRVVPSAAVKVKNKRALAAPQVIYVHDYLTTICYDLS